MFDKIMPMKYAPHGYQRYAKDFIERHESAAVLLDMGLGKTVITLTAIKDLLFDSFEIARVLVIGCLGRSHRRRERQARTGSLLVQA